MGHIYWNIQITAQTLLYKNGNANKTTVGFHEVHKCNSNAWHAKRDTRTIDVWYLKF